MISNGTFPGFSRQWRVPIRMYVDLFSESRQVSSSRVAGGAAHDHPVLGAMMVRLQ